jgi:hypothetical protein
MINMSKGRDALLAKNNRNLRVLRDCLIMSRKPYDIAYYIGRIDSLEHIQQELEGKNV